MKVIFIINDPRYGTERLYDALRLARLATSSWETSTCNRLFVPHVRLNEARGLLRELRLSEQLIQRKFAAPSLAWYNPITTRALLAVRVGQEALRIEAAAHQGIEQALQALDARRVR